MRRSKELIVAIVAIFAILILVLAFFISPFGTAMRIGGSATAKDSTMQGEYIELNVQVSSWKPIKLPLKTSAVLTSTFIPTPLVINDFWTVDGYKKTTVSVTITITLNYKGIKAQTLNITVCQFWFEATSKAYLVDASEDSVNGASEEGTVTKEYSSGSVALDGSSSDPFVSCGCATDGNTYTVYGHFQVTVQGIGTKSGETLTADTGIKNTNPTSWSVQWYGEQVEVQEGNIDVQVTFQSWLQITPIILAVFIAVAVAVYMGGKKR